MPSRMISSPSGRIPSLPLGVLYRSRCRPFHGLRILLLPCTWGSRPRLYAFACSAGSTSSSILRRDLILLQLAIRHFVRPGPQNLLRKSNDVHAQSHAAAQTLRRLNERLRRAQRPEAGGEILQRLLAEVAVRIIGEERTIDRAVLKSVEDFLSLLQLRRRRRDRSSRITAGRCRRRSRQRRWLHPDW